MATRPDIKVWPLLDPILWNTQHGPLDHGASETNVAGTSATSAALSEMPLDISDETSTRRQPSENRANFDDDQTHGPDPVTHVNHGVKMDCCDQNADQGVQRPALVLGQDAGVASTTRLSFHQLADDVSGVRAAPEQRIRTRDSTPFSSLCFAFDPLLSWWWVHWMLRCRVAGIHLFPVWFVSVCVTWFFAVAIFRQSHPLLLSIAILGCVTISSGIATVIDRRIMRMLLRRFEFWYLLTNFVVVRMCN